jgi:hypothetical protein
MECQQLTAATVCVVGEDPGVALAVVERDSDAGTDARQCEGQKAGKDEGLHDLLARQ